MRVADAVSECCVREQHLPLRGTCYPERGQVREDAIGIGGAKKDEMAAVDGLEDECSR